MSLELVILIPIFITLPFLILQAGILYHANNIADAAADEAVSDMRTRVGTQDDGKDAAQELLDSIGAGFVSSTRIDVNRTDEQASAHIEAQVFTVLPGLVLSVAGDAAAPVERIVPDD